MNNGYTTVLLQCLFNSDFNSTNKKQWENTEYILMSVPHKEDSHPGMPDVIFRLIQDVLRYQFTG